MSDFWTPKSDFEEIKEDESSQEKNDNTEKTKEDEVEAEVKEEKEEAKEEETEKEEESEEKETKKEEEETEKEEEKEEEEETKEEDVKKEERSLNEESDEEEEEEYETIYASNIIEDLDSVIKENFGEDITLADVIEFQNKDFDNMDEFDLIEEHLYLQEPDIDDRLLKYEMKKYDLLKKSKEEIEQMIEDGDIKQSDYDDVEMSFLRAVSKAKKELKEFQKEVNISDLEVYSNPSEKKQPQKSQKELEEEAETYNKKISSFVEKKIQVGSEKEPKELTLSVSEDDHNEIRDFISNGQDGSSWIIRRWFDNGQLNIEKLIADADKMIHYERDVAIAYTQGANAKLSEEVKSIDNIDFKKGESFKKEDAMLSEAAQVMRDIN